MYTTRQPDPRKDPTDPDPHATQPPSTVANGGPSSSSELATPSNLNAGSCSAEIIVPASPLGRYRPLRFHARGGLGEVFLAQDEELRRPVALKRIQDRFAHDPESIRRFLQEAGLTSRLDHPGVVPVHGLEHDAEGRPGYAMRFIRGETLQEAIVQLHKLSKSSDPATTQAWSLRQLLSRFVTVCNTVAYAHSRGILHRDLKPANIMLGPFGETLVVDWGLAKEFAPGTQGEADISAKASARPSATNAGVNPEQTTLPAPALPSVLSFVPGPATRQGEIIGTPAFMSPEQAAGNWDQVGPASDIYSLGATLYVLLTGLPPFTGAFVDVLDQVQRGEFPPPRQHSKDLSLALEAICLKAMARRPEGRYATALELAADLERWLADEPATAYTEPWTVRAGRWIKRHRTIVTAAVALLATAAVALAAIAILADRARLRSLAEQAQTEQERGRAQTNLARALRSVDQMLTRVGDERLVNLPQFDEERKQILQDALLLYRELLDDNRNDPEAQLETGKAYTRVGDINHQLGQEGAAVQAYEEALHLLEPLSEAHPGRADFTAALAQAVDQRGLLFAASEEDPVSAAAVRSAFERAIPLWEHALQAEPRRRDYQAALAMDCYRLAVNLSLRGQAAQSDAIFRKTLDLQRDLAQGDAGDTKAQGTLGSVHNSCGAHYLRNKRWTEAEAMCRQALPFFESLHAARPHVPKYQYELSYSWSTIGVVCTYFDREAEAANAYRKSMTILQELLANHPHLISYRSELADNLEDWADVYLEKGWLLHAERELRQALTWRKGLSTLHPENGGYARNLSLVYNRLGWLQTRLRQPAAARDALVQALAVRTELARTHPATALDRLALAEIHLNQGDLLHTEDRSADAEDRYRTAAAILEGPSAKELDEAATGPLRARLHLGLALLELRRGRLAEAEPEWRQALDLADRSDLAGFRAARARELARGREYHQAVAEAETLSRQADLPRPLLGELARAWSLASAAVRNDSRLPAEERTRRAEAYAARAIALLRQAGASGLAREADEWRHVLADPDFDGLRQRTDFRKLS
jgi:serine/threonine-protein kinase